LKLLNIIKNNPFTFIAVLAAVFFAALSFRFSVIIGSVELACIIVISAISAKWYADALKRKKEQVKILSSSLSTGDRGYDETASFPLPVLLVSDEGEIIWFNKLFENLLSDFSKLNNNDIDSVIPFKKHVNEAQERSLFYRRYRS